MSSVYEEMVIEDMLVEMHGMTSEQAQDVMRRQRAAAEKDRRWVESIFNAWKDWDGKH